MISAPNKLLIATLLIINNMSITRLILILITILIGMNIIYPELLSTVIASKS